MAGRHRHRLAHRLVEPPVARREHRIAYLDVGGVERVRAFDHRRERSRHPRHPGGLAGGIAAHADAEHRHLLAQRPQAHQDTGMGERAPRGADYGIEPGAGGLVHDLFGGEHVAEPAERRMPGGGMDHVGPAALGRERRRAPFHRRVRRRLVLALGEGVQGCAQHPVEQQVAGGAVGLAAVRSPLLELDVDCHPEFAPGRGGDAHQVRLHRAGDQHRVGAPGAGLAEVELELTNLVAEGEPGAVLALDPEIDAERRAEIRGGIERRRRMAEPDPREAGDAGKGAGHGGGWAWLVWFVDRVECLSLRRERCRPMPAIASGFCRRPRQRVVGPRYCRRRWSPDRRRPSGGAGRPPPKLRRERENRSRRPAVRRPATDVLRRRARPPRIPRQDIGREALRDARIAPSRTQSRSRCA